MANPSRPLEPKQIEGLNSPTVGTVIKWMSKAQTFVFKKTNGQARQQVPQGRRRSAS